MTDDRQQPSNGDGDEDEGGLRDSVSGLSRRRFLGVAGGGLLTAGGARAAHNTVLGYGQLGFGTNLLDQDLGALVAERITPTYDEAADGVRTWVTDEGIAVRADDRTQHVRFGDYDGRRVADVPAEVTALDETHSLDGRLVELFADVAALRTGEYSFEFANPTAFFERLDDAETRPQAVAAVRETRDRVVDAEVVTRFTGADPTDSEAVVEGLKRGFREHGTYDVPRYLAGSVEDNVLFGAADLRQYFEEPTDFESLLAAEETGLFCWEMVYRSMDALQAAPPWDQTVPMAACYVSDRRHKHAFTGITSAVREGDALTLPTTFVDYTHSTLYDDFRLTGIRGEGLAAYDDGHRADAVYW